MEVHHHHPNLEKKGFKEYFLEFLMIFLAVTLGFFAESYREHIVNQDKEKDYMKSMLVDISADSASFHHTIETFTWINHNIDSLIPLLQDNANMEKNAAAIYYHEIQLYYYAKLIYTNRTVQQLKSSGSFRLIRNKKVADGILDYDGFVENYMLDMQEQAIQIQNRKTNDAQADIFKAEVVRKNLHAEFDTTAYPIQLPARPWFLATDRKKIEPFINQLNQYALTNGWFIRNIREGINRGKLLKLLIKREYRFNN